MSRRTMAKRIAEWGWTRDPAIDDPAGREIEPDDTPVSDEVGPDPALPGSDDLASRLRRLLAHRVALLERELVAAEGVDSEKNARALALNVRTLAVLDGLLARPDGDATTDDDEGPPRSLAELRDELRRHLERIADERDGELRGEPDEG